LACNGSPNTITASTGQIFREFSQIAVLLMQLSTTAQARRFLLLLGAARTAVGPVESMPFELYGYCGEDLAHLLFPATRAYGYWLVIE
jgi:hypothetical protein